MKGLRCGMLAIVVAFCAASWAQSTQKKDAGSDKERLIGAWRLVRIEVPGADENAVQPKGMLIYRRDGHVSVQLMYSRSASALSNEYVKDGYEASFGSYDVPTTRRDRSPATYLSAKTCRVFTSSQKTDT
jgi:hypothetical protein